MKEIKDKAIRELNGIEFAEDVGHGSAYVSDNGEIVRPMRNLRFFTSRYFDDDSPSFTGKEDVLGEARSQLSNEVLEQFDLSAEEEEKFWFTLILKEKE
jgi:hypothetical protein